MKVIPKLNGPVHLQEGCFFPSLPLPCAPCPFLGQFPLKESDDPALTFETDISLPAEGYRLTVTPDKVTVASWDENGAYYGVQTLFQMLRDGSAPCGGIPCGVYEDAPRYRWRGFMLDSGRHFFPVNEVKKVIDACAKLKLNTFHWHLSEDQGFRIESKKFPRLNEVASWRTEPDGSRYGGFYTQEEIKDVVAYAAERYMDVVPEIDLPGHTTAIVSAFPELSCSGEPVDVTCDWGVFPRILCAGNEKVYTFLEELLEEVCALFPSGWFHIGGDEAPKGEWEKCPRCQAEMKKHGLQNEEELQSLFNLRLAEILKKNGKAVIGWNEILASGKMDLTAVAQYWTDLGAEYSAKEIEKGRKFIFSNTSSFYLNQDPALVTLKGVYSYEPHIPGGEGIAKEQVLGLEAPLWTEWITTEEELERHLFPRAAALAENAWTEKKDYGEFLSRLKAYEPAWKEQSIHAQPVEELEKIDAVSTAEALIEQHRRWLYQEGEEKVRAAIQGLTPQQTADILSLTCTKAFCEQVTEEAKKLTK